MKPKTRRRKLVGALRSLTPNQRSKLAQLKRDGRAMLQRRDFLWDRLLASAATLGNSRGWAGLMGTPANYKKVRFGALRNVPRRSLEGHLAAVLRTAKVRMPEVKAARLAHNYDLICALGGPSVARAAALGMPGPEAKVAFLKLFAGVGDKYARNIWMDAYHPEFRNAIAVDERIKSVSKCLGVSFRTYEAEEAFYQRLAVTVGCEGWELDRALYWFRDDLLERARLDK